MDMDMLNYLFSKYLLRAEYMPSSARHRWVGYQGLGLSSYWKKRYSWVITSGFDRLNARMSDQ